MNKVFLIGNLGEAPEVRNVGADSKVCRMRLATTSPHKDKEGNRATQWHTLTCWGKTAEIAGQYLTKGSKVAVEGELKYRQWEDKQGQKRDQTEINVSNLEILTWPDRNQQQPNQQPNQNYQQPQPQYREPQYREPQQPQQPQPQQNYDSFDDDIPF